MANDTPSQSMGMEWKWVIAGVIAGLIIVGASYIIVAPTFNSAEIQALVMMVGFAITGVIVGYFSPGVTIREAGVGGGLVMFIMLVILYLTGANEKLLQSQFMNFLMLLLGTGFSFVGGWVGEKLQAAGGPHTEEERADDVFHWKWVLIGIVIGFALNVLFVFLSTPVFNVSQSVALVAFLISFIITGFIVGYKSPGVTLKEPAVAGIFTVIIDWVFLEFGITLHISPEDVIAGLALGFLFALLGAWLGEKYQESRKADAAA